MQTYKHLIFVLASSLLLFTSVESVATAQTLPTEADFYVATNGNDDWSGRLPAANIQKTDGPFATLKRAKEAVRDLLRSSPARDITILIRGGLYRLDSPVVFRLDDSGNEKTRITYAAFPNEKPVFTSAYPVTSWKKLTEPPEGLPDEAHSKVWVADVSQKFYTLYDSKGMLPRARSAGFIPLPGGSKNHVQLSEEDFKNWSNLQDLELVVRPYHAWIVNILPVVSTEKEKRTIHTAILGTYALLPLKFLEPAASCWIENCISELDQPGEWVLDTQAKKLYLWPRKDGMPEGIVAPSLRVLISVVGKIDKAGPRDVPVRNLVFRGLTLTQGDRYVVTNNDVGLQHDWDFYDKETALLRLRGVENCRVEDCSFLNSGGGAIRLDLHAKKNTIMRNQISWMGGAGILVAGYGPGSKDVSRENHLLLNHLHHLGQIYSHSPGIMLWQSGANRVANNLIHDVPYSAIIISGCVDRFFTMRSGRELTQTIRWNEIGDGDSKYYKPKDIATYLHSRDNVVEKNEIHHAMKELGDGNGIYIRGSGAGNLIKRNYIHHLVAPTPMQAAIRTDGGQRDTLIAENLIYKCTSQGILLKLNNRCENNIIADILSPPRGYFLSLREGPMAGATVRRNIFYATNQECKFIDELEPGKKNKTEDRRGKTLARAKDADVDHNIYFCSENPKKSRDFLNTQQRNGVDVHSRAIDPLFVNPSQGDFRLRPDSPARKMGIKSIDVSEIGLSPAKSMSN